MSLRGDYAIAWANWLSRAAEFEEDLDLASDVMFHGADLIKALDHAALGVAKELRMLCFHPESPCTEDPCEPCALAERLEAE